MSIRLFDASKSVTNQRQQINRQRKGKELFSEFNILDMIRCYYHGWEYFEIDNLATKINPRSKRILERSFVDDFQKLHHRESSDILEKIISYFIAISIDTNKYSNFGRREDDSSIKFSTYQFSDSKKEIITILNYTAIQGYNEENDNNEYDWLISAKIRIRDNEEFREYKKKFKHEVFELCNQFKSP